MNNDTNPLQERIARALYENAEYYGPEPTQPHWDSRDGEERGEWMKVAAAVLPIVAAEVRKAKAEAWDEAASHAESKPWITNFRADDLRTANPYRYETGDQR